MKVNLHVPGARRLAFDLHHSLAEIRPGFVVPETRMQHPHRPPVGGAQLVAPQTLVMPDGLKQPLGRQAGLFVQSENVAASVAPLRIETVASGCHPEKTFQEFVLRSQARATATRSAGPREF